MLRFVFRWTYLDRNKLDWQSSHKIKNANQAKQQIKTIEMMQDIELKNDSTTVVSDPEQPPTEDKQVEDDTSAPPKNNMKMTWLKCILGAILGFIFGWCLVITIIYYVDRYGSNSNSSSMTQVNQQPLPTEPTVMLSTAHNALNIGT